MRISATFPSAEQRGFTLLEMLVVLLLIGLVTAVVMPGLQRMNASVERALQRDQVEALINGLPLAVQRSSRAVLLTSAPGEDAELPAEFMAQLAELDARLQAKVPIFISAAGFCPFGGDISITIRGRSYPGKLQSPGCRLQW